MTRSDWSTADELGWREAAWRWFLARGVEANLAEDLTQESLLRLLRGQQRAQRGSFFLARLAWRAGRPRSQRRACWERERLARMAAEMPCSATPRAGTPAKNLPL
jgi:hypothetical protein